MNAFRVHFYPEHRFEIIRALNQSDSVRIDTMDVYSIGITISDKDPEVYYQKLLLHIENVVNTGITI